MKRYRSTLVAALFTSALLFTAEACKKKVPAPPPPAPPKQETPQPPPPPPAPKPQAARIVNFTGEPRSIQRGQSATLTLKVESDGGTMSFSHGGASVQLLQRVVRGVQQVRGECLSMQVPDAAVALCSGGGAEIGRAHV